MRVEMLHDLVQAAVTESPHLVAHEIGYAYRAMGRRRRRGAGWLSTESETSAMTDPASEPTGAEPTGAESTGAESTGAESTGSEPTGEIPTGEIPTGVEPEGAESTASEPTGVESTGAEPSGEVPTEAATPATHEALRRAAEAVWVASQKGAAWATLAFVPAEPGLRTDVLARALAEVGSVQRREPVEFLDLQDATFANSRSLAETLALSAAFRYVVALGCPTNDHAAQLLAASAAAAVLVVEQDSTRVAAARRVMEIVGSERFLGAVVLEPAR